MPTFPIALDWSDVGKKLVINVAQMEEAEEIRDFLYAHLLHTSPTIYLLNWSPLDSVEENALDWKQICLSYVIGSLSTGPYTLTVRDETEGGKLVAVRLNKIEDKPSQSNSDESNNQSINKFTDSLLFTVLIAMNQDVDLWKLYETERIFHFCAVTVHENYGRRGLAMKLNELGVQLAVQSGAGAIASEAVNCNAARVLAKLGFSTVKTLDYANFEFRGVKPLADNEELLSQHPIASLMVRKL